MSSQRYFYEYGTEYNSIAGDRAWHIYDRIEAFGKGDPMIVAKCYRRERADEICRLLNEADIKTEGT